MRNPRKEYLARWQREWARNNPERCRELRANDRSKHPERSNAYRTPEQWRARNRVAYEIRCGRLVRPESCETCGIACRPHAHHHDYAKPIDVVWLCVRCHASTWTKYAEVVSSGNVTVDGRVKLP